MDVWKIVRELPDHRLVSMSMPEGLWQTYRDNKGKLRQVDTAFAFDTEARALAFAESNQVCAGGDLRVWRCTAASAVPVPVVLQAYAGDIHNEVYRSYAKQVADAPVAVKVELPTMKAQEGTLLCRDLKLVKQVG